MNLEPQKNEICQSFCISPSDLPWTGGNRCHDITSCNTEYPWWWTGRPDMLWFMGSQRLRHNWTTELNWTDPITSWEIEGETVETVRLHLQGGSPKSLQMVTADMKLRCLLLGRKVMTNLDNILKSRDITLATKVHLVRLWFFQWSYMDVSVGLWRKLSAEQMMLLNCGAGEDSWESLGLQGDPTSPS